MDNSIAQHSLFEDSPSSKLCTKCKAIKPLTHFSKDRTKRDGYYYWCKECKTADLEQKYQARLLTELPTAGEKTCSKCVQSLPFSAFHPCKNTRDGRSSWCKECAKEQSRLSYIPKPQKEYQPPTSKCCTECRQMKPVTDFPKASERNGYGAKCKLCKRVRDSKRYHSRPAEQARTRNKNLKKHFGITLQEYSVMLEAQCGVCAICQCPETRIDRRKGDITSLAVDHCHETGRVRSLLCFKCNYALGLLKEDPVRIRALLAYAEKWHDQE